MITAGMQSTFTHCCSHLCSALCVSTCSSTSTGGRYLCSSLVCIVKSAPYAPEAPAPMTNLHAICRSSHCAPCMISLLSVTQSLTGPENVAGTLKTPFSSKRCEHQMHGPVMQASTTSQWRFCANCMVFDLILVATDHTSPHHVDALFKMHACCR